MTDPERTMRIMKYAFIVSVLLFIVVTMRIPSKAVHPPQNIFEVIIVALALVNVALGFAARSFLGKLARANAGRAGNGAPLNQWMSANVVSLAMIESCALFAVVLHMLGSPARVVGMLFGCAIIAFFVWSPGVPPAPHDASGTTR